MIGMDHAQPVVGGEVDVEAAFVLAEIRGPDAADVAMQGGGDGPPVHQIGRAPDEQAGSIVEAGVGEEEIVTHADGAGVGVVSTQDGVAIDRVGLGQKPARGGGQGEGGGGARGGLKKAAASEHSGTSVTPGKLARKTTYECGRLPMYPAEDICAGAQSDWPCRMQPACTRPTQLQSEST